MKTTAKDDEIDRREGHEQQQRPGARPAFRRQSPGPLRRFLRHRAGVYQGTAAVLAAALLLACGEDTPRPVGAESDGLVFVRPVEGSREIFWARLADAAERSVTRTPDREESWPYWSTIAGRLVFQVTRGPGRGDLMLWSPEAGESALAVSRRDERWPDWSPTAPQLAYAFTGGRPAAGLALAEPDTGSGRLLADAGPAHFFLRPSWSPDGSRLVVQRRPREGSGSSLWIVAPGAAPRPLTGDGARLDTKGGFTRDGRQVIFSRQLPDSKREEVWMIGADGGDARRLMGDAGSIEHSGRPSPTRDEFAWVSDRSGSQQVWLAGLDGSNPRQLTDVSGGAFAPRWSPDGERLVVTLSGSSGRPRLADAAALEALRVRVIDRNGQSLFEAPGLMPDWMPAWR